MTKMIPVILCGGSGTRLWPRSRSGRPKPFLPLLGNRTLFQQTLDRTANRSLFGPPIIVVGEKHLEFAKEQAEAVADDARFIVEPMGRNTAPAIALAAHLLSSNQVMLVCPSDHYIIEQEAFCLAAANAARLAAEDWLVSFGIEATAPETGFGYIRRGEKLDSGFKIERFVEKPDLETAVRFLSDGSYSWNGGIFAFRAGNLLAELSLHRPELAEAIENAFSSADSNGACVRPDENVFASISGESIDYAVMENTRCAAMVDAPIGWSDIGNWDALMQKREADTLGNVVIGNGEIIDASNTMVDSDGPHVSVIGIDDVVVIVDGDDVLVTARNAAQRVGETTRCRSQ